MAIYMWREAQPITTSWIYHNSDLWLISLSSDGSNRTTIADKNLGATTVYNSWDTLSEANCGKYYQRGNNYGFPRTWSITTSTAQVNASSYWPWNYYNSSTFRTWNTTWDSSGNNNLRWWVTWTVEAMQWPCDTWYHIPSSTERNNLYDLYRALWLSWYSNWVSYLKFPMAWERDWYQSGGSVTSQWSGGFYWSTTWGSQSYYALFIRVINNSITTPMQDMKSNGQSIRPFKNDAVQPDDTWTVLYQPN